jgi:hypothetical protein
MKPSLFCWLLAGATAIAAVPAYFNTPAASSGFAIATSLLMIASAIWRQQEIK